MFEILLNREEIQSCQCPANQGFISVGLPHPIVCFSVQNIVSITESPYSTISTSMTFSQSFSFEPVKESVSALKMQLEEKLDSIFKQEIVKISAAGWTNIEFITNILKLFLESET